MEDGLGWVQSVLVLGASSEIGQATLRQLAGQRLEHAILAARHPDELTGFAEELRAAGVTNVETVAFDAATTAEHDGFVGEVFSRPGDIDLVLVAFGVLGDQPEAERDAAAALDIVRVNYVGAVSVLVPIAQQLRAQGHGTIVGLSSVAGERARRSNFVYGSSKAGLDAFLQGLADAVRGSGVRVLIVRPGFVRTKMTEGLPAAPLSVGPDVVATAIVNGVAEGHEIVWVPPALRWVMVVLRHLPRPVFRRLPL